MYKVYLDTDDNKLVQINTDEHKRSAWFPSSYSDNMTLSEITIPFDTDTWLSTLTANFVLLITSTECVTKDTCPELFI